MFQNIMNKNPEEEETSSGRKINIKDLLKINDIVLYAIAFLASMVGFSNEFAPFGLAIFAATCSNRIPVGILYIAVLLGTLIGFGLSRSIILFIKFIIIYSNDFNI